MKMGKKKVDKNTELKMIVCRPMTIVYVTPPLVTALRLLVVLACLDVIDSNVEGHATRAVESYGGIFLLVRALPELGALWSLPLGP